MFTEKEQKQICDATGDIFKLLAKMKMTDEMSGNALFLATAEMAARSSTPIQNMMDDFRDLVVVIKHKLENTGLKP